MLYNLFSYLSEMPGARLMTYISFRAILAGVIALLISIFFGDWFINLLHRKNISETQRDEKTDPFNVSKKGVPTMGGIVILCSIIVPCLLIGRLNNVYMLLMLITTVLLGSIGFADDYIKSVILHRRIEHFLNAPVHTVYLINKQYIVFVEICEERGKIARPLNGGAAGYPEADAHLVGDYLRKSGLSEPGRPIKQNVVEGIPSAFCRLYINSHIFFGFRLSYVFIESLRAERYIILSIHFLHFRGNYSVFKITLV